MDTQQAITLINNALKQVPTTWQNHLVMQQALQIVVEELNAREEELRKVRGDNTTQEKQPQPALKVLEKKE